MATNTHVALQKVSVASSVSNIEFTSIPQGYTDLVIVANGNTDAATTTKLNVGNGSIDTSSNYSWTVLSGTGSAANSYKESSVTFTQNERYANWDASSNANTILHIQNYSNTATYKTWLTRGNNTTAGVDAIIGLWRSTAAINTIRISCTNAGRTFSAGATFSLYGIAAEGTSPTPKATGGAIYSDSTYYYHVFGSTGTFTPLQSLSNVEYVVVAGGGGGGANAGSPGGAGGYRSSVVGELSGGGASAQSRVSMNSGTAYTITVGGGGAGNSVDNGGRTRGSQGSGSSIAGTAFTTVSCTGGGYGTSNGFPTPADSGNGGSGGSGGAGAAYGGGDSSGAAGSGTTGEGYAGGSAAASGLALAIGGGGGAGAAGQSISQYDGNAVYYAGNGGVGIQTVMATATGVGGDSGYLAGGGIGGDGTNGTRGLGGGGASGQNGYSNSGGGAGDAANGGSGVVIIRYLKA
jgi:hypothetical protein